MAPVVAAASPPPTLRRRSTKSAALVAGQILLWYRAILPLLPAAEAMGQKRPPPARLRFAPRGSEAPGTPGRKVCLALLPRHIANKRASPKFQVSSLGLARRETRNQKREAGSSKQLEMNGQILLGIFPNGLHQMPRLHHQLIGVVIDALVVEQLAYRALALVHLGAQLMQVGNGVVQPLGEFLIVSEFSQRALARIDVAHQ